MTEEQALLGQAAEECAELAVALSKAVRFGLDDEFHTDLDLRPRSLIIKEAADVHGILSILINRRIIELPPSFGEMVEKKMAKVEKFLDYSRQRCRVEPRKGG